MRYGDGVSSTEQHGGDGKSRGEEKRRTTTAQALKSGQEARRSHTVAFTCQREAERGHERAWNAEEGRRR